MSTISSPDDPRHGTPAGYRAHDRAKVPYCDDCRRARREYDAERTRRHGGINGQIGRYNIAQKAATEDVDWVVVHRIVNELRACEANTAERLEVVRQWVSKGRGLDSLAELTGWNTNRYWRVVREIDADQQWSESVEREHNRSTFRRAA